MQDETYVAFDPEQMHGSKYYVWDDNNSVPDAYVFEGASKFHHCFMRIQCITPLKSVLIVRLLGQNHVGDVLGAMSAIAPVAP